MGKSIKDTWTYDAEYNGKEEGCGDLIMTLFKFFKTVPSGSRVCITAYDKGDSLNDLESLESSLLANSYRIIPGTASSTTGPKVMRLLHSK